MATFTYFDGESGREIVRVTDTQLDGFPRSGRADERVAAIVDKVEWLANAVMLRRFLKSYGMWDDEQLRDDAANRDRALWIACGDIQESPGFYADLPEPARNKPAPRSTRRDFRASPCNTGDYLND